jgi:hypothetical protein
MWHAKCYKQDPTDPFPVLHASDLDDAVLVSEELESDDPDRFRMARDGFGSYSIAMRTDPT